MYYGELLILKQVCSRQHEIVMYEVNVTYSTTLRLSIHPVAQSSYEGNEIKYVVTGGNNEQEWVYTDVAMALRVTIG